MYKHTQIGYAAIVILVAVMVAILAKAVFQNGSGFDWKLHAIAGAAIFSIGGAFSSMTIEVHSGELSWHFSIPWIRNGVQIKDISNVEAVRNPLIYGLGAHMIRRGWVYNVSGLDAVEVTLQDGTTLRLGTDQPDELLRAIKDAKIAMPRA